MNFKNSHIYQRTVELLQVVKTVIEELPPGYAFLADQLRRASFGILLNFAEGCGKHTAKDRKRFFYISKGSSYEVYSALEAGRIFQVVSIENCTNGQNLCDQIGAMLNCYR